MEFILTNMNLCWCLPPCQPGTQPDTGTPGTREAGSWRAGEGVGGGRSGGLESWGVGELTLSGVPASTGRPVCHRDLHQT